MVNYEKETIHRNADRIDSASARSWKISQRNFKRTWHQRCYFLQLESKVWRDELSDVKKRKDLEEENFRLKRIVANLTLENDAIKHVIEKKFGGLPTNGKR